MKKTFLIASFIFCAVTANAQDTTTKKAPIVQKIIVADPKPPDAGLRVADPGQGRPEFHADYPHFPGGPDSLRKFVKANFQLPQGMSNVSGLEIVTFYIETDGSLSGLHITKSISPELDKEAIRVMGIAPKWKPALKDGKPARVLYSIPIRFPLSS